jgi:hypothetical protein
MFNLLILSIILDKCVGMSLFIIATCRPNSPDNRGKPFSKFWADIQMFSFCGTFIYICRLCGCGWGTSTVCRLSLISGMPQPPFPPSFLLDTPSALPTRTSFTAAFAAPHFPSALLMNILGTSTNRILNAPPYRFVSVRLVLSMKGGGGEVSGCDIPASSMEQG